MKSYAKVVVMLTNKSKSRDRFWSIFNESCLLKVFKAFQMFVFCCVIIRSLSLKYELVDQIQDTGDAN